MAGRKRGSYERKHGVEKGRKLHHALQSASAHARWKAQYKKERDAERSRRLAGN